jgi:signal transduction histidine kinase
MVRELLIYSGQEEAELQPVDFSNLVEDMSGLLKASISSRCVLQFDLGRDLPSVLGNVTQIRQLLVNLVINASQAIGEREGVIQVKTSAVQDYVRLEVSDTGCGMTEEEKAKIFDPFFTTKPGGHGLGLAVVQGIVLSHNGAINVLSTPGKGTTFEVRFRRHTSSSESESPQPPKAASANGPN